MRCSRIPTSGKTHEQENGEGLGTLPTVRAENWMLRPAMLFGLREREARLSPTEDLGSAAIRFTQEAGAVSCATGPCTHPLDESLCPVCRWLTLPTHPLTSSPRLTPSPSPSPPLPEKNPGPRWRPAVDRHEDLPHAAEKAEKRAVEFFDNCLPRFSPP